MDELGRLNRPPPAQRPFPDNSGKVRSVLWRAAVNENSSRDAAPLLAVPSLPRGQTRVVSIANYAPPKRDNPSATTSRRRVSLTLNQVTSRSQTITVVEPRSPASLLPCAAAYSNASLRLRSTPTAARSSMMAKDVEETTTSASATGQGARKTQAATKQETKRLRVDPTHTAGREGCEDSRRHWATLGPAARSVGVCPARPDEKRFLCASRCLPRPPMSGLTRLILVLQEMSCASTSDSKGRTASCRSPKIRSQVRSASKLCSGLFVKPVMMEAATAG